MSNIKNNQVDAVDILIIGVDSEIGSRVASFLRSCSYSVIGTSRKNELERSKKSIYFDLSNLDDFTFPPADVILICAAMSKIRDCEESVDLAYKVNTQAPIRIASHYLKNKSHVIFISTDAIHQNKYFSKNDQCSKQLFTVYGDTKLQAESAILSEANKKELNTLTIVRLSKVFGENSRLLVDWNDQVKRGGIIIADEDKYLSPISMKFVVNEIYEIINKKKYGIYQISGEKYISYRDLFEFLYKNSKLIEEKGFGFHKSNHDIHELLKFEENKVNHLKPQDATSETLKDFKKFCIKYVKNEI